MYLSQQCIDDGLLLVIWPAQKTVESCAKPLGLDFQIAILDAGMCQGALDTIKVLLRCGLLFGQPFDFVPGGGR